MEDMVIFLFQLAIFLVSVIIHEVSHGVVAERLGDPTARLAGRLTLNPLAHIDPVGSVLLPLLLALPALFGAPTFIIGWARPVPYNPNNLKNPKVGAALIGAAGPLSNILVAVIFGLVIRNAPALGAVSLAPAFALIVYINILLALFNILPIPPLDGSKLLYALLPHNERGFRVMAILEQYGFILLLAFILWGFGILAVAVDAVFGLIVGNAVGF